MSESKSQNYLHGAAILAVGVVIMKILGFLYKMPIGNIIGDDGYSMFLATYNIYNVFLSLATAGLPIALSRLISEANAEGRPMQVRRTFTVAWRLFFWIGLFCTAVMLLLPEWLATDILHNPPTAMSIRAMAPAVLLVCLVSAYRGYCQGCGNMIPTTVGQVLEVLVKVVVGLVLAYIAMSMGLGKAMGSAGAIFGVTMGSLAALIYMWAYKRRNYREDPTADDVPDSKGHILRRLLRIGIPIALGSSVLALLNLVDSSLCMGRLQSAAGYSLESAQTLYGVYGKAQTIFNLPAAIITPMTISVVPAIAAAMVRGENDGATKISEDSMRIASVLSMPMGVGLAVLSAPIMHIIYPSSHASGPALLAIMGVASFFVCVVLMENAVLQAFGKELLPMYSMITGGVVKIVINWFLVADPDINIYGAPIGTLVSYVVMAIMNFVFMCRVLDKNPRLGTICGKPMLCSVIMGACAWAVYGLASKFIGDDGGLHLLLCLVLAMGVAVVVYMIAAISSRAITANDMELIPGGKKIARLLHMN